MMLPLADKMQPPRLHVERWTCLRCCQLIGEIRGTTVTITHERRTITATLPCSQTCPKCGTLNSRMVDADQPIV